MRKIKVSFMLEPQKSLLWRYQEWPMIKKRAFWSTKTGFLNRESDYAQTVFGCRLCRQQLSLRNCGSAQLDTPAAERSALHLGVRRLWEEVCWRLFFQRPFLVMKAKSNNHGNPRGPPQCHEKPPRNSRPYDQGLLTIGFPSRDSP